MNLVTKTLRILLASILILSCKQNVDTPKKVLPAKSEKASNKKKTQSARTKIYSPEKELAGFSVPDGFIIELVASEADGVINPIDLAFDDSGNLWTQTAKMYPLDPVADIHWSDLLKLMDNPEAQKKNPSFKRIFDLYEGKTKGDDAIIVLSNLYGNTPVKAKVWADGLAIPQSILPYKNGVYVAQGSELFFLEDKNNDGKADSRKRLFTGFGITDTHTMTHVLVRAPGDWVHFSQGALNKGKVSSLISGEKVQLDYSKIARFSLDAKHMEIVNSGLNNIWGFQLRGNGQWYGTEANDLGYSIVPMELGTGFPGIGSDRIRPYQPWMPTLHEFRVGGTGISSLAFADDSSGSFPEEWKDVALLANPITSSINAVKIIRNADGSITAKHLEDLLTSEDDWFRPVNMEFGPDGCLYIADWYNKIVSHNELPTTHPDRDKKHGRIWRIRHKSQKPRKIINFYEIETRDLVAQLKSPSLWAKRAAWHQISDRPYKETKKLADELVNLAGDHSQDESSQILALWSLEGIYHFDQKLMKTLIASSKENLRREAVRSLSSFSLKPIQIAAYLTEIAEDKNPMIRSQVLRTIEEFGTVNNDLLHILVAACKPVLEGNNMGGAYERNFERFLARKALEKYPTELELFINSKNAKQHNSSNLIWASQALPKAEREIAFIDLWKQDNLTVLDESTFVITAAMLSNNEIYELVKPVLEKPEAALTHVNLALKNQGQVQSDKLTMLLEKPVIALISSSKEKHIKVGLIATAKFKVNNTKDVITLLINENTSSETLKLAIQALESRPKENQQVFKKLASNKNLQFKLRDMALHILSKSNVNEAINILEPWLLEMNKTQLKTIATDLSVSKEGSKVLKKLYENKKMKLSAFDISSAERVLKSDEKDPIGKAILVEVKNRMEKEKLAYELKFDRLMKIAEKGNGNPKEGETLFQVCLMCHKVGTRGQDIAPALDGSGMRENEALLTAILNPDAALESSYAVYRISKKDGSSIEGYLVKKDDKGTTIAFMGGGELFIQSLEIKSEGFLGGRSFMVKGLIDHYTEKQFSDLLSYIKTLK